MSASMNGQMIPATTDHIAFSPGQVPRYLHQTNGYRDDVTSIVTLKAEYRNASLRAFALHRLDITSSGKNALPSPTHHSPREPAAITRAFFKGPGFGETEISNASQDSLAERRKSLESISSSISLEKAYARSLKGRWRGGIWTPALKKRACSIKREAARLARKATSRKSFDASTTAVRSSGPKTGLPAREADAIPSIVIMAPEEDSKPHISQDTNQPDERCRPELLPADQVIPHLQHVASSFERMSITDRSGFNNVQENENKTDMEICDAETLQVPDVESSDESDMDDDNYWEWDPEKEQFRHWDEESQKFIFCPDEFD